MITALAATALAAFASGFVMARQTYRRERLAVWRWETIDRLRQRAPVTLFPPDKGDREAVIHGTGWYRAASVDIALAQALEGVNRS